MAVQVVGSLHLDVLVNAPRLPDLDETLVGKSVAYAFGGKGGNQAVAAARMGADVAMVGRVGSDDFAGHLLEVLDRSGVDRQGVQRGEGASGMSVAILNAEGDYGAVIVSAANLEIAEGQIDIAATTAVLCLQNEVPGTVNLAAAQKANAAGATVILNAAPARKLSDDLLALTDVLIVNRGEAAALAGEGSPEHQVETLLAAGAQVVVVTLGAEGLIWACAGVPPTAMAAHRVAVVSTHGAGDAFVGALAAVLDREWAMPDALSFAQAAAALHVSTPVEGRSAITRADVDAFRQVDSS